MNIFVRIGKKTGWQVLKLLPSALGMIIFLIALGFIAHNLLNLFMLGWHYAGVPQLPTP